MKSFKSFVAEKCWPGYKSVPGKKAYSPGSCMKEEEMEEDWSQKYKSSIDCNNPKGFSQKAHCAGKKKNEDVNESAAAAIAAATAIAKKKSGNYDEKGFRKTPYKNPDSPNIKTNAERKKEMNEDWSKVNKSDKTDGLSQKAVDVYRRENPGSKLKTAVTKDPSKLKAGSKDANRRKSFCSRMSGMKKRLTNPENARDPDSPINKALRRWNC